MEEMLPLGLTQPLKAPQYAPPGATAFWSGEAEALRILVARSFLIGGIEALSRRPTNRGLFRQPLRTPLPPLRPHGKARTGEVARRLGVS
jgi:hypothetical protein